MQNEQARKGSAQDSGDLAADSRQGAGRMASRRASKTGRERLTRAGARREMPAAETTSYIVPLIMLAVALVLILGAVGL